MTDNKLRFKNIAISAARLAAAKKTEPVTIYDMAGRSELADYVVVVTVDNPMQLDAVDDEIVINLKKDGLYARYRDGMKSKNWKVLDYGGIIIHIFEKQAREFFSFDKVYAGYSAVKWEDKPAAKQVTSHKSQVTSSKLQGAGSKKAIKKAKAAPKKTKTSPKKAAVSSKKTKKSAVKKSKKATVKKPVRKAAPKKATARKLKKAKVRKSAPKRK